MANNFLKNVRSLRVKISKLVQAARTSPKFCIFGIEILF